MQFFKDMFSASNAASFGRGATLLTVLVGCFALLYVVLHGHALPDALTLGGLAGWMSAPYAINKTAGIFGSKDAPQMGPLQIQGSAEPPERRWGLIVTMCVAFVLSALIILFAQLDFFFHITALIVAFGSLSVAAFESIAPFRSLATADKKKVEDAYWAKRAELEEEVKELESRVEALKQAAETVVFSVAGETKTKIANGTH